MQEESRYRVFSSLVLLLTISTLSIQAQDSSETTPRPGHSLHGDAFDEGPRQRAYLMQGMPDLLFPVNTRSPDAQKFFNQGVGQLHGFWYFEAERSFRQVLKLDTNCVMAYWGLTMANVNNSKRAKEFIQAGIKRTNGIPRREFLYIDSLAKFYLKEKNDANKHRDYIRALETIVEEFPDDLEAKAFLVFKIWENQGRQKVPSHLTTDALTREVLAVRPMHPLHHARIHYWNNEADRRALDSAAKCGPGAPGIAHMWHMPGHTYSALHRYVDATWQQEASARVDHSYMMENRILPDQIHNYAHNNDWLAKNLSHVGRVNEAIDLAKNLIELPRHPKYNSFDSPTKKTESTDDEEDSGKDSGKPAEAAEKKTEEANTYASSRNGSASFGRARLLELLVQWELWDEIIDLSSTVYLDPTGMPHEQAKRARALGSAYFAKGDTRRGKAQIAEVSRMLRAQKDLRHQSADEAEEKAKGEKKNEADITKAMNDAIKGHASKIKNIESALAELRVYNSVAANETKEAREQMAELKDVPKTRLAQLWLTLGDKEQAEKLALEALKSATNQVHPLANYVDILARAGKEAEAIESFKTLTGIASSADLNLPILKRIQPVAQKVALAADWRVKLEPAKDLGNRPAIESLGPFRWQPSPAIDWTLKRSDGRDLGLRAYQGRPVIMLFYLGHGCMQCIQQLNDFAPRIKDFDSAGISVVAVSTDSVEGLRKTLAKSTTANGFPFPVVSDESLATFKAYRAYDDFEEMPLHGAFLIDGNGMVRWHDVSFEPFKDVDFLLAESQRLLKLPVNGVVAAVKTPDRRPLSPRAASQLRSTN